MKQHCGRSGSPYFQVEPFVVERGDAESGGVASERPLVSIIVNNYNYGRFLAEAIASALNQTYQHCEVVVVDDGSTDDSHAVIAGFGTRIMPVLKEHGGQASALNAGFDRCHGEIVIFLDADDLLEPGAVERYVHAFHHTPRAARVQSRLAIAGADGRPGKEHIPSTTVPLLSGDFRAQVLSYPDDLPWSAMSGNAYPRWVLSRVMPIPTDVYPTIGADMYLLNVTPLFGPVVSLDVVGGYYRVHGDNAYHRDRLDLEQTQLTITLSMATHREIARLAATAGFPCDSESHIGNASLTLLGHRMNSKKLAPNRHPIASDTLGNIVVAGIIAAAHRRDRPLHVRLAYAGWLLAMALSPAPVAQRLATLPFRARRRSVR